MYKFILIVVPALILILYSTPAYSFEVGEIGAGGQLGLAVPFGWFTDVNLHPNIQGGVHFTYSLDNLIPNLVARASLNYLTLHGDRHRDHKYKFRDLSFYAQALYFFDIGLPAKPYIMAGLGFDFTEVSWDYKGDYYSEGDSSGVGHGITFGAGAYVKMIDRLGLFAESNVQTSSWAKGPGFGDFILNIHLGATFYFTL